MLSETTSRIKRSGPTRVVTKIEDDWVVRADTANAALRDFGIVPTNVLIRDDGWSLGYDGRTAHAAFDLWKGEWVAVLDLTTGAVTKLGV